MERRRKRPPLKPAPPPGFEARRFLVGNEEMVVASFPVPAGPKAAPLSPAEQEIITALLEGRSYAEIARRRRRSTSTVAKQAGSAFRKLGVSSRSELAARGILPLRSGGD